MLKDFAFKVFFLAHVTTSSQFSFHLQLIFFAPKPHPTLVKRPFRLFHCVHKQSQLVYISISTSASVSVSISVSVSFSTVSISISHWHWTRLAAISCHCDCAHLSRSLSSVCLSVVCHKALKTCRCLRFCCSVFGFSFCSVSLCFAAVRICLIGACHGSTVVRLSKMWYTASTVSTQHYSLCTHIGFI